MHSSLLSIIVPILNGKDYLHSFLSLIQEQVFRDFELLFIDGGSEDDTKKIILDWNYLSNQIQFLEAPGSSIYEAMNIGIDHATGEFLFFMGVDDSFSNELVLNYIFNLNCNHREYDFVYGNVFFSNSKEVGFGKFDAFSLLLRNIPHQACFYKKEIFSKIGKYNPRYLIWADWELNMRLFNSNGIKILYINQTVCNFNTSGTSGLLLVDRKFRKDFPKILRANFSRDLVSFFLERRKLLHAIRVHRRFSNKLAFKVAKLLGEFLSFFLKILQSKKAE